MSFIIEKFNTNTKDAPNLFGGREVLELRDEQ